MLIASQKPNVSYVAGFRTWSRLGRFVKKGEKGQCSRGLIERNSPEASGLVKLLMFVENKRLREAPCRTNSESAIRDRFQNLKVSRSSALSFQQRSKRGEGHEANRCVLPQKYERVLRIGDRMNHPIRTGGTRSPSPLTYILISGAGLVLAVCLLIAYVFLAPRLLTAQFQHEFFFVVLIIAGLVAAAFLVGGMQAYDAHVTYKHFGLVVKAGGAVAVFLLVVGLGLYAIPKPNTTFNLTVRPTGPRGESVRTGRLTIQYADKTDSEAVGNNGEANFKQIPADIRGQNIRVIPEIEGFDQAPLSVSINSVAVDVALLPENFETPLIGSVRPPPGKGKIVRIVVEGEDSEAIADDFGRFRLIVHKKSGSKVRLRAYLNEKEVYDDFEVVGGPVTLVMHKPR